MVLDPQLTVPGWALGQRAARPRFSALCSARGNLMPTLQNGLERFMAELMSEGAMVSGCVMTTAAEPVT